MSKTVPDISVIVVNYNYAKYIGDALESIKCQSLKNIECIIIDDASTDNSIQIIRKYTQQDKRFILVQQTSHDGVSAARNRGLDIARGRYIAFLDSDDCFTEYALEMLLHMAETTGADMAGGATNIVADKFRFIPSKNHTWIPNISGSSNNPSRFLLAPLTSKWCWIWRRIYRRELIGDTRFRPEFKTFGDDLTFMLDICYRANLVVETQNISAAPMEKLEQYSSTVEFLEEFFKHRGLHEFKKSEFAQLVKDNITDTNDVSPEITEIIKEIKGTKVPS